MGINGFGRNGAIMDRKYDFGSPSLKQTNVSLRGDMFNAEILEIGRGDPVLFLHGIWDRGPNEFLETMSNRFKITVPSHPGFGESTGEDELADFHDLVYYYLDLLDEIGLRGIPLIGHSLGGMIAAELAAVQPDRFTKLVLIAPLGLWNQTRPTIDFFAVSQPELASALYSSSELQESYDVEPKDEQARIDYTLDKAKSLAAAARFLWPIPNRGLHKRIHRITAPTLLVWGESDGIVPIHYGHYFEEKIPGASIEVIKDAAHLVHLEQRVKVGELVAEFIG